MVRRALVLLFVFVALLTRSGAGEAVENALHLLVHGHSAHQVDATTQSAGDAHQDIEHGCVGHFHVCPCCGHQPVTHGDQALALPPGDECIEHLSWLEPDGGPEGAMSVIFRPPIRG